VPQPLHQRKRLLGTVLQTGPSFTMMEKTCHPS